MFEKFYTTKMSENGKMLKHRFAKMRTNVSKRARFASYITLAVIMSVFAFGACLAAAADMQDVRYQVYDGEKFVNFKNEPFVYKDLYYLPLRETLNIFGITDIAYDNGQIEVSLPAGMKRYSSVNGESSDAPTELGLEIGKDIAYLAPNYGNVAIQGVPILYNDLTYVPIYLFEILIQTGHIPDFQFNVIRTDDPKAYYSDGEEVYIGTVYEQDAYNPVNADGTAKIVKRIIVDENGKALIVIPVEKQIKENIEARFDAGDVNFWRSLRGYKDIAESLNMFYNSRGEGIVTSVFDQIYDYNYQFTPDDTRGPIAYVTPSDIIRVPNPPKTYEGTEKIRPLITNTYGE